MRGGDLRSCGKSKTVTGDTSVYGSPTANAISPSRRNRPLPCVRITCISPRCSASAPRNGSSSSVHAAGSNVRRSLLHRRTLSCSGRTTRFDIAGLGRPVSSPARLIGDRVDEQHLADEPRVRRALGPGGVALGVGRPVPVADDRALHLQAHDHAGELGVERGGKLRRGRAERALHPLALGFAHLADPAVLEPGHRRHEQQDHGNQRRDARESAVERHRSESSMRKMA